MFGFNSLRIPKILLFPPRSVFLFGSFLSVLIVLMHVMDLESYLYLKTKDWVASRVSSALMSVILFSDSDIALKLGHW